MPKKEWNMIVQYQVPHTEALRAAIDAAIDDPEEEDTDKEEYSDHGDAASKAMDAHVHDMVTWVRAQGGGFNRKLQIRRADTSDPTSYFEVFLRQSRFLPWNLS